MDVGDTFTATHTYTEDEVRRWTELIGDAGRHHLEPDARGRLMVHGLLVGALPTQIGGEMDYIARQMVFEFKRPVFTGDTVTATLTLTRVEPAEGKVRLAMTVSCVNQDGVEVVSGSSYGIVLEAAGA